MKRKPRAADPYAHIERAHREARKRMQDMRYFVLPDRPTLVFRVTRRFEGLGGVVPCVTGVTMDGKQQTTARLVDVEIYTGVVPT